MTERKSSIALGFFDGVHIAHQEIIKSAVQRGHLDGCTPVALTFDKSPAELLRESAPPYITTTEEKLKLINALGAQMYALHTDRRLLEITAEEFVKRILVEKFNAKHVICGYNYHFGSCGKGDAQYLKKLGAIFGFETEIIPKTMYSEQPVSSSRIRDLIMCGDITKANLLLGRSFSINGIVSHGKMLGRTIGFPTANVYPPVGKILPKNGVYETIVTTPDATMRAITNTGINPTVGGEKPRTETYIPSLKGDLYGVEINIEFIRFIRPEKKFPDIEELKKQINADVQSLNL